MRLRNAGGVRGVTMVPEADGDDSRHCRCREEETRMEGTRVEGQQGMRASTRQVLPGPCCDTWEVRRREGTCMP